MRVVCQKWWWKDIAHYLGQTIPRNMGLARLRIRQHCPGGIINEAYFFAALFSLPIAAIGAEGSIVDPMWIKCSIESGRPPIKDDDGVYFIEIAGGLPAYQLEEKYRRKKRAWGKGVGVISGAGLVIADYEMICGADLKQQNELGDSETLTYTCRDGIHKIYSLIKTDNGSVEEHFFLDLNTGEMKHSESRDGSSTSYEYKGRCQLSSFSEYKRLELEKKFQR